MYQFAIRVYNNPINCTGCEIMLEMFSKKTNYTKRGAIQQCICLCVFVVILQREKIHFVWQFEILAFGEFNSKTVTIPLVFVQFCYIFEKCIFFCLVMNLVRYHIQTQQRCVERISLIHLFTRAWRSYHRSGWSNLSVSLLLQRAPSYLLKLIDCTKEKTIFFFSKNISKTMFNLTIKRS